LKKYAENSNCALFSLHCYGGRSGLSLAARIAGIIGFVAGLALRLLGIATIS